MARDPVAAQHQHSSPLTGPRLDALLLEFSVDAMAGAISCFGTLSRAILFTATARACGPLETAGNRAGRPISVNALASSLRRPFETTRRNVNALIAMGLLERLSGGLHVPMGAMRDPRATRFSDHCHDLLVRLTEDLRASNMPLPAPRADIDYDVRAGMGIAFDLLLAVFECRDGDDHNLMRVALLTTVEWGNRRFAHEMAGPPRPVPIKAGAVARTLGLPYATAARNLDLLVRQGALDRLPEGLIVPAERMTCSAAQEARAALAYRARQLLGRLAQTGFPAHRPATGYIHGRPPHPAFG